ncbi:hypothetical protein [Rubellimicrobium roseum]|uniref:Uncharacterized protein n=1 Tax=Rubellimicrobium roseum TaxID=687525 RepID=A0A5C4N6D9_9RHOB|nr:hypothetical protein [Rubellimicrobium roseum]TNC60522.1 hypothetical protein FHG71_21915 [Rubellimicrobium roseum]
MNEHLEEPFRVGLSRDNRTKADTAVTHALKGKLASVQDSIAMPVHGKKVRSEEPNILDRVSPTGRTTFRVQIRRQVDGKMRSLGKTFRTMSNATKWRNRKLAEIEFHGFPVTITTNITGADVITKRLEVHTNLERSAKQVLNSLMGRESRKKLTSTLTAQCLYKLCDNLLGEEMLP